MNRLLFETADESMNGSPFGTTDELTNRLLFRRSDESIGELPFGTADEPMNRLVKKNVQFVRYFCIFNKVNILGRKNIFNFKT